MINTLIAMLDDLVLMTESSSQNLKKDLTAICGYNTEKDLTNINLENKKNENKIPKITN